MVDILTKQTTNQEFLDFAVEQVHNADIVTTHAGEPSAQVCDLLLNKNGKLYIATSSQNPFFKDLIAQPKVIVDGYKGDGRWTIAVFQFVVQSKMLITYILMKFSPRILISMKFMPMT